MTAELAIATEAGLRPQVDFVSLYRSRRSPALLTLFRRLQSNADSQLAATGVLGLLVAGDAEGLVALHRRYRTFSQAGGWNALIQALRVDYVNRSPASIAALKVLASDSTADPDLTSAAADALARLLRT